MNLPTYLTPWFPGLATWQEIIASLVGSLSQCLQQNIQVGDWSVIDGEALRCPLQGESSSGLLALHWRGLMGIEVIDGTPHISATIFLLVGDTRLRGPDHESSYIELAFDGQSRHWHSSGLQEDIYGEYDGRDNAQFCVSGRDSFPVPQET